MPVLGEELSLYPENLLEEMDRQSSDRQWCVAYTLSRQEKAFARDLLQREIPFYLPVVKKPLRYGRRTVHSLVPLFGGYVFLHGTDEERAASLTTNRVSRMLPVPDPERLHSDLRQLNQLITSGAPLTIESRLAPGRRVRVRSGPFDGVEGTVASRRGNMRLIVDIDFLQQGVSVEFLDYMVEPVNYGVVSDVNCGQAAVAAATR